MGRLQRSSQPTDRALDLPRPPASAPHGEGISSITMADPQPLSVAVFIDGSNVLRGARDTFQEESEPASLARTWPHLIGEWLLRPAAGSLHPRRLHSVRVHEGYLRVGEEGRKAQQRQHQEWRARGKRVDVNVEVFPRSLVAAASGAGRWQEVGVDVALALDCLHLALSDSIDVAIIFSEDQDYEPLIDHLLDLERTVEVAHWWNNVREPQGKKGGFLARGRSGVAHRFLDADAYEGVRVRRSRRNR